MQCFYNYTNGFMCVVFFCLCTLALIAHYKITRLFIGLVSLGTVSFTVVEVSAVRTTSLFYK